MNRLFILAACAALLTGCDFVGEADGTQANIAGITLTEAPLQRANGASWDEDGAPDLFVEVQDISGHAYFRSEVFENMEALPAEGLDLGAAFELPQSGRSYYLVLVDADPDGNELMGVSNAFRTADLASSATVEIGSENGALGAVIQVTP